MSDDHPGFTLWDPTDAGFPFDEIKVRAGNESAAEVWVDFLLPQAQPEGKAVAVRYAGVEKSTQLWFALECTRGADGTPACELVLRARHFHWWPAHNETGPGPLIEVRVPMAELGPNGGEVERLLAHGRHCDELDACWFMWDGKIRCQMTVEHHEVTVQQLRDIRARLDREAERQGPRVIELPPWPTPDAPKPPPELPPEGSMAPERPGGLLGGLLALVQRMWRAVFG
jgi:hypothetical protein